MADSALAQETAEVVVQGIRGLGFADYQLAIKDSLQKCIRQCRDAFGNDFI